MDPTKMKWGIERNNVLLVTHVIMYRYHTIRYTILHLLTQISTVVGGRESEVEGPVPHLTRAPKSAGANGAQKW